MHIHKGIIFVGLLVASMVPQSHLFAQNTKFAVAKYSPLGVLDSSFNSDGKVVTNFNSSSLEYISGVALDNDGKLVTAGAAYVNGEFKIALARYNHDGSLDRSFDGDGKVLTKFNSGTKAQASSLAIDASGRIIVAGHVNVNGAGAQIALVRYNHDGSLDTSFDGDGKVLTDFYSSTDEYAEAIAIDFWNRIVVAGYATIPNEGRQFAVVRYNTDGSLDTSFDKDGKVLTKFNSATDAQATAVTTYGYGNIVVAGFANVGGVKRQFALARYNQNGTLDTHFDQDGKVLTNFVTATAAVARAITINGSLDIAVAGSALVNGTNWQFAVAKYKWDGSLDNRFDKDGKVLTNFSTSDEEMATAVRFQESSMYIVVAGVARVNGKRHFALARYNNYNGALDTRFDGDGKVLTDFPGTAQEGANAMALDWQGRIYVGGFAAEDAAP